MTVINRRQVLQTLTAASVGAAIPRITTAGKEAASKPSMHVYDNYGWLRGFNVIPSWGARIEDAWWNYNAGKMREELALARSVHANAICLWIDFSAWYPYPEKVAANFLDAIAAIDEQGMKAMPCLFNRWHNGMYDYGGIYVHTLQPELRTQRAYLDALVPPLAAADRVFCWNLCNEPAGKSSGWSQALDEKERRREFLWLESVHNHVRTLGTRQPITVGTMDAHVNQYGSIEFYEPLMDVLCGHPYVQTPEELDQIIVHYKKLSARFNKPLLCNEGVPGSDEDPIRGATHRYYWEKLSAAGFGLMPWSIREGRAVASRRDRMDGNGINRKGFHPTFNADGTLRAGHEWMREKPKLRAPWEEAAHPSQ